MLPNVLLTMYASYLEVFEIRMNDLFGVFILLITILFSIYMLFMYVAVWRSSNKHILPPRNGSVMMAGLAKFTVVISLFKTLAELKPLVW